MRLITNCDGSGQSVEEVIISNGIGSWLAGVEIDWLVLKVEGVASLLAYKRIAFDLVVLPKIEVLNAIIEFDLGKLATGSLGLVITESQGASSQLEIQLGAGLVVDPASLLQEYIKSDWIRNALTTIFPFLNIRLEISLNFAFDKEGFGARLLQLFGLPAELSGSLGTAVVSKTHLTLHPNLSLQHTPHRPQMLLWPRRDVAAGGVVCQHNGCCYSVLEPFDCECCVAWLWQVVRMPSNGASARRLRSVTFSFFGSLGSSSFLLSITFCTDGSDCTSDVYTMSILPDRMICRSGDGAPNLLNQCTPRSGYIGVTVLTCIRPDPSRVVRKFDISRYDASCPAGTESTLGLCWETCRAGYDGWVPRVCWASAPTAPNRATAAATQGACSQRSLCDATAPWHSMHAAPPSAAACHPPSSGAPGRRRPIAMRWRACLSTRW
ncbi:hypothetical protein HaLaN_08118, partial [Haematococcus lacustris]